MYLPRKYKSGEKNGIHLECIHLECIHLECIHLECIHLECIHLESKLDLSRKQTGFI
jgi:hypothetical protein